MTSIAVIGGTGYAGSAICREAARRGHSVTSFSRFVPQEGTALEKVNYEIGSMLEPAARAKPFQENNVVVSALSPRGDLDGRLVEVDSALAVLAGLHGTRFAVVGGFSSLRMSEDAPRVAEGDLPPQFAAEARQMNDVLTALASAPDNVDWFYISPAMQFGSQVPGEALGHYRVGADVALLDDAGISAISGADFAKAIIDEIENPTHHRQQFSVAY